MNIKDRLYNDFFRPSKEKEYEQILSTASCCGYKFLTVSELMGGGINGKTIVIRRDVDTRDNTIQYKLLHLEKKYNAKCTSFFRNNTKDVKLMRAIEDAGGEATYHYEEIATYCYKHRIRNREDVLAKLSDMRAMFVDDIKKLRKETGLPIVCVSSHGDYVNRKIHLDNKVLLDDETRNKSRVLYDAYDKEYLSYLTCRIHDHDTPNFTLKAIEAIERGEPVIELLTHPRQWNSPIWVNLKEEISRIFRGLWMKL